MEGKHLREHVPQNLPFSVLRTSGKEEQRFGMATVEDEKFSWLRVHERMDQYS